MAIEIVDLPIYPLKIVISHSYVKVYQRVPYVTPSHPADSQQVDTFQLM